MTVTIKAFNSSEVESLADLSQRTFLESHGHSAKAEDIRQYIGFHFNEKALSEAFRNPEIHFRKILVNEELAGYSKLILNQPHPQSDISPIAKFERLYLLKDFYGLGLGEKLLAHNLEIARAHHQKGLWLFVWTENEKALKFYQKSNFKIVGKHDFKISKQHSNPNYVMLRLI